MPHIHEKIDFTVEVFVVYNNKVLLRKHDKYGIWLSVGGHVELDDDPNQAAIREVAEEVGLDVELYRPSYVPRINKDGYDELIPPQYMNRHRINENHEHVTHVYFATAQTDAIVLSETEVAEDVRWFTFDEIDQSHYGIDENIRIYAKSALKTLKK